MSDTLVFLPVVMGSVHKEASTKHENNAIDSRQTNV
jgi:hypothetical protein